MIALETHPEGTVLPVRARPAARRNEIRGHKDGMLRVCVTQAAEKGKANKALTALLSKWLGVRKSQVELISGETCSHKQFLIRDVTRQQLSQQIERILGQCS